MRELTVHGRKVDTVFELLGSDEDSMTYSLGWALSKCDAFCSKLATKIGIVSGFSDAMHIKLQEYSSNKGFTDIEIVDPGRLRIIIEAKRGFNTPSMQQLEKYADRLLKYDNEEKMLVVLAESDRKEKWLKSKIPSDIKGVDVKGISWKEFQKIAHDSIADSVRSEKEILRQLIKYLEEVTNMQNQTSNLVYVVSVSNKIWREEENIGWIDIITKYGKYFHPVGNRWPVEPPNYIGFRYHGKLQSIHHIESYEVIEDYQEAFGLKSSCPANGKHYLYTLGPPIYPVGTVKTQDKAKGYTSIQYSARCACFIDLLLTCGSVSEAFVKTKKRLESYK